MATKNKEEQIFIQIDNERIELLGDEKEAFIAERNARDEQMRLIEAEQTAKREARESALRKLAHIAGLSPDEISALLGQ